MPEGNPLARSNYSFQKRQKELARKKKKEEKRQRKLAKKELKTIENPEESLDAAEDDESDESG